MSSSMSPTNHISLDTSTHNSTCFLGITHPASYRDNEAARRSQLPDGRDSAPSRSRPRPPPLWQGHVERVATRYNAARAEGWSERGYDSLRRNFRQMYSTRMPTGDPFVPPHIRTAKEIMVTIDLKVGLLSFEDKADEDFNHDDGDDSAPRDASVADAVSKQEDSHVDEIVTGLETFASPRLQKRAAPPGRQLATPSPDPELA